MEYGIRGKAVLVTGAGSGIGRACALAFAREGARVVVSDIVPAGGEGTVRMIQEIPGEAVFVQADVTKAREVESLVSKTVEAYGRLDCAVNNAGIEGAIGPIEEFPEEDWDRVIAVDLKGVWLCMKYEVRQMARQGAGAIVNTASVGGVIGAPYVSAYIGAKHGVNGITKSVALECAAKGIRVNSVCPMVIETPMIKGWPKEVIRKFLDQTPIGRIGRPEEVAQVVLWLCSEAASLVTGTAVLVDGGVTAM
ncbi:MAG: glucose 1-dehydrogenase [Acidobacteriota bacterium]